MEPAIGVGRSISKSLGLEKRGQFEATANGQDEKNLKM